MGLNGLNKNEAPKGKQGMIHFLSIFWLLPLSSRANDEVQGQQKARWKNRKYLNNQQLRIPCPKEEGESLNI